MATGESSNVDLAKMSEIVKSMPQYNALMAQYTMHFKLIEDTWSYLEEKDLRTVGDIE